MPRSNPAERKEDAWPDLFGRRPKGNKVAANIEEPAGAQVGTTGGMIQYGTGRVKVARSGARTVIGSCDCPSGTSRSETAALYQS